MRYTFFLQPAHVYHTYLAAQLGLHHRLPLTLIAYTQSRHWATRASRWREQETGRHHALERTVSQYVRIFSRGTSGLIVLAVKNTREASSRHSVIAFLTSARTSSGVPWGVSP